MKIFKIPLRRILIALALIIICINVGSVMSHVWGGYTNFDYWQRFPALKRAYLGSQYVNKHPAGWIPDETVFAYAAGAYIQGVNPVLIIPDAPPLGKYLIGLSILIFNNEVIIIAIFGILSLFCIYLLSLQIFKDHFLALLPPLLFSFEPIFRNQFIYSPLFDLFQLVFLLLYLFCMNKAFLVKKNAIIFFLCAGVLLGAFIATKFFASGVTLIAASLTLAVIHKMRKQFFIILFTIPLSIFILLASYARVFAFGYTIHQFLGIQKWVFLYHQSQIIFPLSSWDLLLFNRWHVWFGNKPIISDGQWVISWPIITILSITAILMYLFKKIGRTLEIEILMLWVIFYLIFLSFGQIFSRYFLILIPCLYIIALYGVVLLAKEYFPRKIIFEKKRIITKRKK